MFADERKAKIADMLKRRPSVTTSELTETFGVSLETIRRDLECMESHGQLKRVHGGAIAVGRLQNYTSLSGRRREHLTEKHSLALKACSYIKEGDFIALDAGSTTYELAVLLGERFHGVTVLTHSLELMEILGDKENIRIILAGGSSWVKKVSMQKAIIGLPHASRYCLGISQPVRLPVPPAKITAMFMAYPPWAKTTP